MVRTPGVVTVLAVLAVAACGSAGPFVVGRPGEPWDSGKSVPGGEVGARRAVSHERQDVDSFVRSGLAFLGPGATHVWDRGRRIVNGAAIEEYQGTFSGAGVQARFGSLVSPPAGATIGDGVTTLDVDPATGLPVRMQDTLTISARLANLRPALSGRLVAVVTSTRVFSGFGPSR